MNNYLHIVSFDVPYPANYGGVIDVFYKIKSLSSLGVKIILHCYQYGREESIELESICEEVNYYERDMSPLRLLSQKPFIVNTRNSNELRNRLLKDEYPILFEGLHSCYFVDEIPKERLFLRNHNVECDYYKALAKGERNLIKRLYFNWEASKLKAFEREVFSKVNQVICISEPDQKYFVKNYGKASVVSAFHQASNINLPEGNGDYCFYHGNLSVGENDKAAIFLVEEVFNELSHKLVIAGNSPSKRLKEVCLQHSNIDLLENVSTDEIMNLMKGAHINVLPTFQSTGIKLKLLLCLFKGRTVIANKPMVEGTGLEGLVTLANDANEFKLKVNQFMETNWFVDEVKREDILAPFSNQSSGENLFQIIFK